MLFSTISPAKKIVFISLITICIIFIYGRILEYTSTPDILERKVAECNGCDGWAITHFLLFTLFGYLFPNMYAEFFVIGTLWEFIETYIGTTKIMILGKRFTLIGDQTTDGQLTGNDDAWWYGRITDIAFNMGGYILGDTINKKIIPFQSFF